jgi:hypothetical protein
MNRIKRLALASVLVLGASGAALAADEADGIFPNTDATYWQSAPTSYYGPGYVYGGSLAYGDSAYASVGIDASPRAEYAPAYGPGYDEGPMVRRGPGFWFGFGY